MAFNNIMTHWFELGQGNKQYRDNTVQLIYDKIITTNADFQHACVFAYHDATLLPSNPEMYYYAVDALNDNINMLNKNTYSEQEMWNRHTQIYKLIKQISGELSKRQLVRQGAQPILKLVRQINLDLELEFATDTML